MKKILKLIRKTFNINETKKILTYIFEGFIVGSVLGFILANSILSAFFVYIGSEFLLFLKTF